MQMLLVVERFLKQQQSVSEDKFWEHRWVVVAGKRLQAESIQQTVRNKPLRRKGTFLQIFFTNLDKKNIGTNLLWQFLEILDGKSQ